MEHPHDEVAIAHMPSDPTRRASWLDQEMMKGINLARIMGELIEVNGAGDPALTADGFLGRHRHTFLQGGLRRLPPESVRLLLHNAGLLLELQELALLEGGEYWHRLLEGSGAATRQAAQIARRVEKALTPHEERRRARGEG